MTYGRWNVGMEVVQFGERYYRFDSFEMPSSKPSKEHPLHSYLFIVSRSSLASVASANPGCSFKAACNDRWASDFRPAR